MARVYSDAPKEDDAEKIASMEAAKANFTGIITKCAPRKRKAKANPVGIKFGS